MRYARFTTGYEYKFTFGVQPSRDIETFGGETDDQFNFGDDHSVICHWRWYSQRDIHFVLEELNRLEIPLPDFEKYPKNKDGTQELLMKMKMEISDKPKTYLELSRFRLGCAIYHQLLYTSELDAEYNLI